MAAPEPPAGEISPQLTALREAKQKVDNKNLACAEVTGKMFVLYKNPLRKMLKLNGPLSCPVKLVQTLGLIYQA